MVESVEPIRERIQTLLIETGYERVRSILDISRATYYNWRTGKSSPSVYQVLQILDAEDIPISWLNEEPSSNSLIARRLSGAMLGDAPASDREKCIELAQTDISDDPVFKAALDWHRETDGAFGDGNGLLDQISAFSLIQGERQDGVFDYQHFGIGSMAAAYYGIEYAKYPQNCREVADREFEEWASQFYRSVISQKSLVCHDISKIVQVKNVTRLVHYRRLVLPGRTSSGHAVVVVIARESAPSKILSGLTLVG